MRNPWNPARRRPVPASLFRTVCPAFLLVACLVLPAQAPTSPSAPPASPPQGNQITGLITESGFTRTAIAVPPCKTDASTASQGRDILSIVADDLEFSGYFRLVDPALFSGINLEDRVDYDAWKAMDADYLLLSTLRAQGGQLTLEGRLFDVKRKEMVTGKRIKGPESESRTLAHNLSAVILDYLFGAGIFPTSQILFTSHLGSTEDIFLCDYDGKGLIRLTAMGQLNVTPDVSPKGDRMVFTSILKDRQELFLLDRQGRRTKLYGEGEGLNANPRFSHDGRFVAFCSSRSGNPDVWLLNIETRALARLTVSWAIDTAPSWSPDDQKIAFTSDRSGSPQIYVMDRDGANVKRLSPEGSGRCDQPAWSPRGDKIAYSTFRNGHFDIAVVDLNSGEVTYLTDGPGNSESPSWSPDGRYLAFSSNRSGSYQIYIMRWDGSGVKRITNQPDCYGPCWFRG